MVQDNGRPKHQWWDIPAIVLSIVVGLYLLYAMGYGVWELTPRIYDSAVEAFRSLADHMSRPSNP